MVWLTGRGLVVGLLMVVVLVGFVFWQGLATFWPQPVVQSSCATADLLMGEVTRETTTARAPT